MNSRKILNLNSYEWWRNHRRFVTIGIFLALFAGYVRGPSARDFKIRETCAKVNVANGNEIEAKRALKLIGLKNIDDILSFCYYFTR
tara:strand:+ start:465 stop:725 length:261 start_codon:yes stop_codon:yes gene_type:complete